MIKEQEQAIKTLENFIDYFQTLIKQADKANDDAFDKEQAEQNIKDFQIAIQVIKDFDKMKDIAIDLLRENGALIEKLKSLEVDRNKMLYHHSWFSDNGDT